MNEDLRLNDISNELLIVSKITIDNIFKIDKPTDPLALYIFYYKTAKWQKTNRIKANDLYVRKCLGWGSKRVTQTKKILQKNGLIKIIQSRKDGKIDSCF